MAKVIKTTVTNKGIYQVFKDEKGQKYFKKHVFNGIIREIEGYNLIKYYYNVPKLVEYDIVNKEITYEYCEDLNSQTIHHGLFGKKTFNFETIINGHKVYIEVNTPSMNEQEQKKLEKFKKEVAEKIKSAPRGSVQSSIIAISPVGYNSKFKNWSQTT